MAKEKEVTYEWAEAADIYESAIPALVEKGEILNAGETQERAAYCRFRASYQSETKAEFKALLGVTSETYSKAAEIYQVLNDPRMEARVLFNHVMEQFYRSWLIEEPAERKKQVERCVQEFKEVLDTSEKVEDNVRYGRVTNDFLQILFSLSELSFAHTEGREIIEEALNYGSKALKRFSYEEEVYELARCYYLLSLFLPDRPMDVLESVDRQQELHKLGMSYAENAVELSAKAGDPYLKGLSCGVLSLFLLEVQGDSKTAISLAQQQLEIGGKIKDRLVLARANEHLSYYIGSWVALIEEDRDKIRAAAIEGLSYAIEAISNYKIILNPILTPFLARTVGPHCLATLETDLDLKRKHENEGLQASISDLEYATESGSLMGQMYIYTLLGGTYLNLAKLERDILVKSKLINESMRFWEKYINSATNAQPFRYWNISVAYNKVIDLRGQLAENEENPETQTKLLLEAIEDVDKSIQLFNTHIIVYDTPAYRSNYAVAQIRFGEILYQMHSISGDDQYLAKAHKHFTDAIETYKKTNMPNNIAEILWKKAWTYYQIHDYLKSAAEFEGASSYYHQTSEKYPNHKQFYNNYSSYMEAWGNIARAMDYHSRDEYFLEQEYFEKAYKILSSSERWRYLGPNYQAWGKLAEAENQSRNDQCEKAIDSFKNTSELFSNAKKSIMEKIDSIGVKDEANIASKLVTASDLRVDYCQGRVALEEAKHLDRKGEYTASSRRYGDAAQIFNKIVKAMQMEQERQEIKPLHSLCLAWQTKTQAEAEASPKLYLEASQLFEKARELSTNEKTRLLTRGHASFCRALSAGIRYEVNREERYHQELVRHIGSATDFYVRAGYDSALEYSRATQRLFEAYQYVDRARGASEPEERARFFSAAERLLGVSAEAFQRARHPEKRDEVIRLLRSLREDKLLALSLSEILDSPGISSSTESFKVPTPSHEYPVGLEGFERADVQVKIFLPDDTLTSGEEFGFELEFYNPGKSSSSLIHVEGLVPDDFEVSGVSGIYRFHDGVLDLRGKRIGPLSTVEVSLKARPHSKGEFTLEPRVMFVDDSGEQRFSHPEPGVVKVREMGIINWLRGTRPSF